MKGWVYVITNKAMPGLVKIGYSSKDPYLRARELDHTGSPHPYMVEYEVLVHEPNKVEQQTHKFLSAKHEAKEWFRCTLEEAASAIKQIAGNQFIIETYRLEKIETTPQQIENITSELVTPPVSEKTAFANINIDKTLCISPRYQLTWEESKQKYMILYPEGIVELNQSSAEILKLCDSNHTLPQIIAELEKKFATQGLENDISQFISVALKNGWIQST